MSHPAFARIDHRAWPCPAGRWTWTQRWTDLLFAHWPIPASALRPLVPAELEIEEFDGTAWIGVVPFRMFVRPRVSPPIPGVSSFTELNVRTYVRKDGISGVWFFSLDASNRFIVWSARTFFHLPYFHARMSIRRVGDEIVYSSERLAASARFTASYAPSGAPFEARRGSLEHWLTERYCLYASTPNGVFRRGDVHHVPWRLQPARATLEPAALLAVAGISAPTASPILHYSARLDVALWPMASLPA